MAREDVNPINREIPLAEIEKRIRDLEKSGRIGVAVLREVQVPGQGGGGGCQNGRRYEEARVPVAGQVEL
ncbi:MAG: hypothetical protein QW292_12085 [Candidatus Parvarchaeota archaeon]